MLINTMYVGIKMKQYYFFVNFLKKPKIEFYFIPHIRTKDVFNVKIILKNIVKLPNCFYEIS